MEHWASAALKLLLGPVVHSFLSLSSALDDSSPQMMRGQGIVDSILDDSSVSKGPAILKPLRKASCLTPNTSS